MSGFLDFDVESLRKSLGLTGEDTSTPVNPVNTPQTLFNPVVDSVTPNVPMLKDDMSVAGFDLEVPEQPKIEMEEVKTPSFLDFDSASLRKSLGLEIPEAPEASFAEDPMGTSLVELEDFLHDKNVEQFEAVALENIEKNKTLQQQMKADPLDYRLSTQHYLQENKFTKLQGLPDESTKGAWNMAYYLGGGDDRPMIATDKGLQDVADIIFEGMLTPSETQEGKRNYWWRVLNDPEIREQFLAAIPDKGRNKEVLSSVLKQFDELKTKEGISNADLNEFLYSFILQLNSNLPGLMALGGNPIGGVLSMGMSITGALATSAVMNNTFNAAQAEATNIMSKYLNGDITKEQYEGTLNTLIKPEFLDPATGKPLEEKIKAAILEKKGGVEANVGFTQEELESTYKYTGDVYSRYFKSVLSGEKLAFPEHGIVYNTSSLAGDAAAELLTSLGVMLVTRRAPNLPGSSIVDLLNIGTSNFAKNMVGNVVMGKSMEKVMSFDTPRELIADTPMLFRPLLMQAFNIVPSVIGKRGFTNFMGPVFEAYGDAFADSKMYAVSKFFQDMGNNLSRDNVWASLTDRARNTPIDITQMKLKDGVQITDEQLHRLDPNKAEFIVTFNPDGSGNLKMKLAGDQLTLTSVPEYLNLVRSAFVENKETIEWTSKIEHLDTLVKTAEGASTLLKQHGLTEDEAKSLQLNSDMKQILSLVPMEYKPELEISQLISTASRQQQATNIIHALLTRAIAASPAKITAKNVPIEMRLSNALSILHGTVNAWLSDSNTDLVLQLKSNSGNTKIKALVSHMLSTTMDILNDPTAKEKFNLSDKDLAELNALSKKVVGYKRTSDSIMDSEHNIIMAVSNFTAKLNQVLRPEERRAIAITRNANKALGEDLLSLILLRGGKKPSNMSLRQTHTVLTGIKKGKQSLSISELRSLIDDTVNMGAASIAKHAEENNFNPLLFNSIKALYSSTTTFDSIKSGAISINRLLQKLGAKDLHEAYNALSTNMSAIFKLSDLARTVKEYAGLKHSVGFSNESQRTLQIQAAIENVVNNKNKATPKDKTTTLLTPLLDSSLIQTMIKNINTYFMATTSEDKLTSLVTFIQKTKEIPIFKTLGLTKADEGMVLAMYGLNAKSIQNLKHGARSGNKLLIADLLRQEFLLNKSEDGTKSVLADIIDKGRQRFTEIGGRYSEKSNAARESVLRDAIRLIGDETAAQLESQLKTVDLEYVIEEFNTKFKNVIGKILKVDGVDPETAPIYTHANLHSTIKILQLKSRMVQLSDAINTKMKNLASEALKSKDKRNNVNTQNILAIAKALDMDLSGKNIDNILSRKSMEKLSDAIVDKTALHLINNSYTALGFNLEFTKDNTDAMLRITQNYLTTLDGTRLVGQVQFVRGIAESLKLKFAALQNASYTNSRIPLISEIYNLLEDYKIAVRELLSNEDIVRFGADNLGVMKDSFEWSVTNLSRNLENLLDVIEKNPKFPLTSSRFSKYVNTLIDTFDISSTLAHNFFENLATITKEKNYNFNSTDIDAAMYSSMQALSKLSISQVKRNLTTLQSLLPSKGPAADLINFAKRQYYTLLTKESFAKGFRYTIDPFFGFSEEFKEIQRVLKLDNETFMSNVKLIFASMFDPMRIKATTDQFTNTLEFLTDPANKRQAEKLLYKALYWKFSPDYIDVDSVDEGVISSKVSELMNLFTAANETGLLKPLVEQLLTFFASGTDYNITLKERQSLDLRVREALQAYATKEGKSYEEFENRLKSTGQNVGDIVDVTGLLAKDIVGDLLFGGITDDSVLNLLVKTAPIVGDAVKGLRSVSKQITYYALQEGLIGVSELEKSPYAGLRQLYLNAQERKADSFNKNPINSLKILTDTRYYFYTWVKEFLHKFTSDILDTDDLEKSLYENKALNSVEVLQLPSSKAKAGKKRSEEKSNKILLRLKDELALIRFVLFGEGRSAIPGVRPMHDRALVDHVIEVGAPNTGDKITYSIEGRTITLTNSKKLASRTDSDENLPALGAIIRTAHGGESHAGRTIKGHQSSFRGAEFGIVNLSKQDGYTLIEVSEDELKPLIEKAKGAYGEGTTAEVINTANISSKGGDGGHVTEKNFIDVLRQAYTSSKKQTEETQTTETTKKSKAAKTKEEQIQAALNFDTKSLAPKGKKSTLKVSDTPFTVKIGNKLKIDGVIQVGGMDSIKEAVGAIPKEMLDPEQEWVRTLPSTKSLKPDVWLLSVDKNGIKKFTFLSLKKYNAEYIDATSTLLTQIPMLRAFIDLSAHRLNDLLDTWKTLSDEDKAAYVNLVNSEQSPAYTKLVKSLEDSFQSAPFIVKIVTSFLEGTYPEFQENPFRTRSFNSAINKFITSISENQKLYESILAYKNAKKTGAIVDDDSERIVEDIVNTLYESLPWFKDFENLIERNHDEFVQQIPNMMKWIYEYVAKDTKSEAIFTQRLMNVANGLSRDKGIRSENMPLLEAQDIRSKSILGDIRKLDPSYLVFAQMVSNPFTTLTDTIGELITTVKSKKFVANVLEKSGMIHVLPSNSPQLKYYESNPEYEIIDASSLPTEPHNEIFGRTLAEYLRHTPALALEAEKRFFYENKIKGVKGDVTKPEQTEIDAIKKAIDTDSRLFKTTKVAIHKSLSVELKNLYEEVDKHNLLHRFLSNLMADYRYEYNGAVLTLNHIGWIRNFLGAVVLPMYALGPVNGIKYAIKAMSIMRGYGGNAGATELANFKMQNRTVPMANARFSAEPFANMHSIRQEETSKQYKLASLMLVKPIQITNKIGFKLTQKALNTGPMKNIMSSYGVDTSDPFTMMAGLRNLYGAVDEISKFAVFLAAKEGKVEAPTASTWINTKFKQAGNDALSAFSDIYGANKFRKDIGDGTLGKMSNEDAFKFARQFSFTYEQLPKFFQGLRTYYNPFISFVYNSGRILGNAMKMYPFRTIATYVALKEMNAILEHQYGISINFNTVIPGMDMMDAMSAGTFPDSMNPVNPTAPMSKMLYMVWNNRDPYTKQELPEAGLMGRIARGYSNSIFTMSPTLNAALRTINHALPYDTNYVEQSKVASYLESLLPKSYIYTKAIEQAYEGKPVDRFNTRIRPWIGMMYALGGLNISVTDQIKLQRESATYAKALKSAITHYNKLIAQNPYGTNKDLNMEIQKARAKVAQLKKRFGEVMYDRYGFVPYVSKDEYNPYTDGNIVENVLDNVVNDLLAYLVPGLFGKSVPYTSAGRAY